ncbi:MAG TPA: ROK family protein [Saprospiraceae bacterium]|nr:ROK family protein [Saprospiraceae bacterium]
MSNELLLGIDLGGTKIEAAIIRKQDLFVVDRMRIPTNSKDGYDAVVNRISQFASEISIKNEFTPHYIGLGTPGCLDPYTQTMKNSNSTILNGMPLKKDLEMLTGKEVRMSNDANCFAIAEAMMGAVPEVCPDAQVVFGVILGTGVGGGLVVNGRVVNGKHSIGGEWGHNFLDESGGPCYCGKSGCVEKVLSGPNLEKFYFEISGKALRMADIVKQYREGEDEFALQTMHRLFYFFGKAITQVINIVDPDVIVIGGGVGNIDEIYIEGPKFAKDFIFNNGRVETLFVKPKLGDSAGVFGAAML